MDMETSPPQTSASSSSSTVLASAITEAALASLNNMNPITTVSAKKFIFRSRKKSKDAQEKSSSFRRCRILEVSSTGSSEEGPTTSASTSTASNTNAETISNVNTNKLNQTTQELKEIGPVEAEEDDNDDEENFDTKIVIIPERMQASYGLYVWPCAPILAWYLFEHREFIQGKKVLELGAGTALPGIVAALCGASQVILTDSAKLPHTLEQCQKSIEANNLTRSNNIQVIGLTWGLFLSSLIKLKGQVDLLIGSDCFYDPSVFEDLLSTVSYILESNPGSKFLTTYQERSSDWSIVSLLAKWGLVCKHILLNDLANSCEIDLLQLMQDHTIHLLEIKVKPSI